VCDFECVHDPIQAPEPARSLLQLLEVRCDTSLLALLLVQQTLVSLAMTTTPGNADSIVWTEEESSYLRAVMSWESMKPEDIQRRKTLLMKAEKNAKPPVGEFRILVIGAKDTGKTSILTRVRKHPLPRLASLSL
jgi:polynucleotide 5'-kinase involved in rRNA processing